MAEIKEQPELTDSQKIMLTAFRKELDALEARLMAHTLAAIAEQKSFVRAIVNAVLSGIGQARKGLEKVTRE